MYNVSLSSFFLLGIFAFILKRQTKRQTGIDETEGYDIQQRSPAGNGLATVSTMRPCGMRCNHLATKALQCEVFCVN